MARSFVELIGDGVTKVFAIDFPLLSRDHLYVLVDGVEAPFSFIDDSRISFATPPPVGVIIYASRETPHTALVDYQDGSTLSEQDLDMANTQSMFVVQEAYDKLDQSVTADPRLGGAHNARDRVIKNVADPIDPTDAANKHYVDGQFVAHVNYFDQTLANAHAEADRSRDEADRATDRASFAASEADRVSTEAERSKAEADRSYSEAERSRIEADRAAAYKGPCVRPEEFGADPSGIIDSSAALANAIRAAHDQGLPLYCTGIYRCASCIQVEGLTKSITIFGDGRGITKFVGTSAYGILNLIFTYRDATVDIQDLSIVTTVAGGGTALRVEFANATSWAKRAAVIQNVDILPSDYTAKAVDLNFFNNGIVLMDAWNSYISNVNILGNTNQPNMNAGIYFQGASIASTIDKCDIYFCDKGILCEGSIEGFRVHDGAFVACNWGVYHNTAGGEPEFKVTNSHFNCWQGNIFIRNVMRGVVTANFFKALDPVAFGLAAVAEFVDIVIEGSGENAIQDIHIHNNQINTPLPHPSKAVVVGANANAVHIKDNTIRDRGIGVHVLSSSGGRVFVEDNYMPSVTIPVQFDNHSGCYYRWDQPDWCRVYRTTYAGITPDADYAVPWNAREGNNLSLWSGTSNTKLYVPAHAALVRVTANVQFNLTDAVAGAGWRWVWISKNGQFIRGLPKECFKQEIVGSSENNSVHLVSGLIAVQPGDYFELVIYHEIASGIYLRASPESWMTVEVMR